MAKSILGDINPVESSDESTNRDRISDDLDRDPEADESMVGGSQHDRTRHSGSRDVTEGTTGGTGTGGRRLPELQDRHRRHGRRYRKQT